ncbi:hypothetical protein AAFF_G00061870 [Aldrovandia affinis]|uniref:Uncharacterized protein n=1 Tax=Aldrovandia affinis TaxID=143900 RepID=A0AAD7RZL0_9TELE|nr:hypothetical protein AAFF_G00061870 [Aldrovandia affinis]
MTLPPTRCPLVAWWWRNTSPSWGLPGVWRPLVARLRRGATPPRPQDGEVFLHHTASDALPSGGLVVEEHFPSWGLPGVAPSGGAEQAPFQLPPSPCPTPAPASPGPSCGTRAALVPPASASSVPASSAEDGGIGPEGAAQVTASPELPIPLPGEEGKGAWGDSSGGGDCPRGSKAAPSLEVFNRFDLLDSEMEVGSPLTPMTALGLEIEFLGQSRDEASEPPPTPPGLGEGGN